MKTKTFTRKLTIKGVKKDFGFGPGVVVQDQITFKDERGRGFDSPMFTMALVEKNEEFIRQHIEVITKEVKPKRRKK